VCVDRNEGCIDMEQLCKSVGRKRDPFMESLFVLLGVCCLLSVYVTSISVSMWTKLSVCVLGCR